MEQSCILIQGGKRLNGEISVQGSKNTVLPIMAACLLTEGKTKLYHVPRIADVFSMIAVMEELGCAIWWEKDCLLIDTSGHIQSFIPRGKAGSFRGSALLMGALLGRNGKVSIEKPGGCKIGERPLNFHLDGFQKMGAFVTEEEDRYECTCEGLMGTSIFLPFPSVGATENLMIGAAKARGVTWIHGCAKEPEICDLALFLRKMGVRVEGAGTSHMKIFGRSMVYSTDYTVPYDRIVAATYLMAAVVTEGKVKLKLNEGTRRMENVLRLLEKMGAKVKRERKGVGLTMETRPYPLQIETGPHPGIPTDVQSMVIAAALRAAGPYKIKENIFESRFEVCKEMEKMGGNIRIDRNQALITPVRELIGTTVYATDLRGGAALCLAALTARGETRIEYCSYIKRGYVDIVKDLSLLGAQIQEVFG